MWVRPPSLVGESLPLIELELLMGDENKYEDSTMVNMVVENDKIFKGKLGFTQSAYSKLQLKKLTMDILDFGSGAMTGAGIASSAVVAKTFFSGSGLLSLLGLTSAVTPIGWVIAAGAVGGGLSLYFNKFMRKGDKPDKGEPIFIKTELDLFAANLFEQLCSVVLHVNSHLDLTDEYRNKVKDYFVRHWGYSEAFVKYSILAVESQKERPEIATTIKYLLSLKKYNSDFNIETITKDFYRYLADLVCDDVGKEKLRLIQVEFASSNNMLQQSSAEKLLTHSKRVMKNIKKHIK